MNWRQNIERWPGGLPLITINKQRTGLLMIDMQHVCAHPDYGQGKIMKEKFPDMWQEYFTRLKDIVIPNQQKLLSYFRKENLKVIYTTVGPELQDGSDMFLRRRTRTNERKIETSDNAFPYKGSFVHSILDDVKPLNNELVVNKNTAGAFNSSPLDQYLRNMGIDGLIIVGTITNGCVGLTARDAADRGYNCILVEDGCATFEEESHYATLKDFARMYGKVMKTDEVLDLLVKETEVRI